MLPSGNEQGSTKRNNNNNGMKWIRNEMLSPTPKEAKILMVRYIENGRFGPNIQLKLAFAGDIYYMSIPTNKKDIRYKVLLDAFGNDENDWPDQRIMLYLEKDEFSSNSNANVFYQRISVPPVTKTVRK